jgi:hypothetical protein
LRSFRKGANRTRRIAPPFAWPSAAAIRSPVQVLVGGIASGSRPNASAGLGINGEL